MSSLDKNGIDTEVLIFEYPGRSFTFQNGSILISGQKLWGEIFFGKIFSTRFKSVIFLLEETIRIVLKYFFGKVYSILIHDHRYFPVILIIGTFGKLLKRRTWLIWDLREIPNGFLSYFIMRYLFSFLVSLCDVVFVANESRLRFLRAKFNRSFDKAVVLNNFVDSEFVEKEFQPLHEDIRAWLGDSEYVYIQNPNTEARLLLESLNAVVQYREDTGRDLRVLISGTIGNGLVNNVKNSIGSELSDFVWFTGMVDEDVLASFFDNAIGSFVFYANTHPNREFAEPNRLYQSVGRGCPFLCGNNTTLAEFASATKSGLVCGGDGSNWVDILVGLNQFMDRRASLKSAASSRRFGYTWKRIEKDFLGSLKV